MLLTRDANVHSRVLRESAGGEMCTFQIPGVCNRNPDTTTLCHLHEEPGDCLRPHKKNDVVAAFGCSSCSTVMTRQAGRISRESWLYYATRGMVLTWGRWIEIGMISIRGAA